MPTLAQAAQEFYSYDPIRQNQIINQIPPAYRDQFIQTANEYKRQQAEDDQKPMSPWKQAGIGGATIIGSGAAGIAGERLAESIFGSAPKVDPATTGNIATKLGSGAAPTGVTGAEYFGLGDMTLDAGLGSAAGEGATVAAPEAAGTYAGYLAPAAALAGIGLGGYGLYDQFKDEGTRTGTGRQALSGASSGAALGAGIGSFLPGVGTLIGGAAGGTIGGLGGVAQSLFASGKGRNQLLRDAWRQKLIENEIIGNDYKMELPGGVSFDWGKDGGAVLPNVGNIEGRGTERNYYQTDLSNPEVMNRIGAINAIGQALSGGDKDLANWATGYASNTVSATPDVQKNIMGLVDKLGGRDRVYGAVLQSFVQGDIDENQRDAALAGLDKVYEIQAGSSPEQIAAQIKKAKGMLGL